MIHVNNFANGALNPALSYVVSCVGCFLGLRCTTRARAYQGAARARWLTLAALSIGTTGIWVMHFIAMLGFAIPGEPIRYNVPFTILSMLIAVVVVGIGVFIVGFIFSAIIALSPTAAEIVEEGELMKRIGQSQATQATQAAQSQAGRYEPRGWQPPPSQPYQPYQARDEPGPDEPGSLFRPRRPSDQRLMLVISA